jgi:ferritin-like metal-binding protein YciE
MTVPGQLPYTRHVDATRWHEYRSDAQKLITWVQHAQAMEAQSLAILLNRAPERGETVPVRLRLEVHLGETYLHLERLQTAARGGEHSKGTRSSAPYVVRCS